MHSAGMQTPKFYDRAGEVGRSPAGAAMSVGVRKAIWVAWLPAAALLWFNVLDMLLEDTTTGPGVYLASTQPTTSQLRDRLPVVRQGGQAENAVAVEVVEAGAAIPAVQIAGSHEIEQRPSFHERATSGHRNAIIPPLGPSPLATQGYVPAQQARGAITTEVHAAASPPVKADPASSRSTAPTGPNEPAAPSSEPASTPQGIAALVMASVAPRSAIMPPQSTVEAWRQATRVFRDCSECPEMVRIPGGSFTMGDQSSQGYAVPRHRVSIRQFALGQYPVTVGEWRTCLAETACAPVARLAAVDDRSPMHNVSWDDARQYIAWLSRRTGKLYRLPSEAEWEYAARGGTTTRYWWGDQIDVTLADCADCGARQAARAPLPVGGFRPNPFGLHDMLGGVAEWTQDCWLADYRGAPTDQSARETHNCMKRVLRGGSFRARHDEIASAARWNYDSAVRYLANGFRVARDLD
jgi:formylglycine-generating enzyme required for sulfatase activity